VLLFIIMLVFGILARFRFNGPELKRRIRSSGKPAELIAYRIGRTKESLKAYEAGRAIPTATIVMALAAELDCSPEDLFTPIPDDMPDVAARASERSRIAQGLPAKITDPAALDETAELMRRPAY
jgi:transcriptional regulator with XRE-family HTH domain